MLTDATNISCPAAVVYETAEEARLLLLDAVARDLTEARHAVGEAAYHLSDAIEPHDRESLRTIAERSLPLARAGVNDEDRAFKALILLSDAAVGVEEMLRGPNASSELRIALRALRRAIGDLARHIGLGTSHLHAARLRHRKVLRRIRSHGC